MKQFLCCFVGIVFLTIVNASFAVIQCPESTQFVNEGDTIQQVIQKCGPPEKTIDIKKEAAIWTYTLVQFGEAGRIGFSLLFVGNNVSKIVTTQGVRKNQIHCPRGTVRTGNTPSQVVAACGEPTNIHNISPEIQKETGKITHLIYQPETYLPKTTFIFRNNALIGTE